VNGVTYQETELSALATSAALAAADLGWRRRAACRDTDPDLFFPVGTTGAALVQIDQAKAVCEICHVKAECLQFALATNQDSGIWGGTSEEERRKLRRAYVARQRAAANVS
jgi:WhiB family redox-sensing transcriptional regulator